MNKQISGFAAASENDSLSCAYKQVYCNMASNIGQNFICLLLKIVYIIQGKMILRKKKRGDY